MAMTALVLSVVAILVASAAAWYTRQMAGAANNEHKLHLRQDHDGNEPQITITPGEGQLGGAPVVWYTLHLDGPRDLDSVIVKRPITKDRLIYQVSAPGGNWADQVDLGSLKKNTDAEFVFSAGTDTALPRFAVEISCSSGNDAWQVMRDLTMPPTYVVP